MQIKINKMSSMEEVRHKTRIMEEMQKSSPIDWVWHKGHVLSTTKPNFYA